MKRNIRQNSCLKENDLIKFDVTYEEHVFNCDKKNALIDEVKFLKHNCGKKDKLIKLLKENETNTLQQLGRIKESIKRLVLKT